MEFSNVDGDYNIVDVSTGVILASTIAANADYGNQEINNFVFPRHVHGLYRQIQW